MRTRKRESKLRLRAHCVREVKEESVAGQENGEKLCGGRNRKETLLN